MLNVFSKFLENLLLNHICTIIQLSSLFTPPQSQSFILSYSSPNTLPLYKLLPPPQQIPMLTHCTSHPPQPLHISSNKQTPNK